MTQKNISIGSGPSGWVIALLLFLSASGLWNCKAEDENYFQEEILTQAIVLGQFEAYEALELDYLSEVLLKLNDTNVLSPAASCLILNDAAKKVLTLTFNEGCVVSYGFNRIRSGSIIISYPTAVGDSAANRSITFSKYIVNSKEIEGQIDLQYDSVASDTARSYYTCKFTDFKVTFPDGTGATYNGTQKRVWTTGENDTNIANNSYLITNLTDSITHQTEPLSGSTTDGHEFTTQITAPVLLNYYCAVPGNYAGTNGVVAVPSLAGYGARLREILFGNQCDKSVTVQTWRRSFPITVN